MRTVYFIGGPMHGQHRTIDNHCREYRVPVLPPQLPVLNDLIANRCAPLYPMDIIFTGQPLVHPIFFVIPNNVIFNVPIP